MKRNYDVKGTHEVLETHTEECIVEKVEVTCDCCGKKADYCKHGCLGGYPSCDNCGKDVCWDCQKTELTYRGYLTGPSVCLCRACRKADLKPDIKKKLDIINKLTELRQTIKELEEELGD